MVWGQKQGEGLQPVNPGQRQSSSQRGCLPHRDNPSFPGSSPCAPLPCRGGGAPAAPRPAPLALRLPPAAAWLCTWAEGGGVCSAALRLSSARGREQELFVPVACRLAAAHRGSPNPAAPELLEPTGAPPPLPPGTPMPPVRGSGDWDTWERTARPFAHRRHPPAHAGLLPPWHVPSPRSVAAGGTGLAVPTAAMVGAGSRR